MEFVVGTSAQLEFFPHPIDCPADVTSWSEALAEIEPLPKRKRLKSVDEIEGPVFRADWRYKTHKIIDGANNDRRSFRRDRVGVDHPLFLLERPLRASIADRPVSGSSAHGAYVRNGVGNGH